MQRKNIIVFIALIIVFLPSACGNSDTAPGASVSNAPETDYVTAAGQTNEYSGGGSESDAGSAKNGAAANPVNGSHAGENAELPYAVATPGASVIAENPPDGTAAPVTSPEKQDVTTGTAAYTCSLSVRCDTILSNMSSLNPEKAELVPEDGVIFSSQEALFYEGESVFNVLQREMKRAKIHLEFADTPIYDSAYIKGINNLYEFDCGELSGWLYKVNGLFSSYGCSNYQLQPGDVVEIVFSCDLGRDVGREIES